MPYPQDPGGRFSSVAHRKVLGHLSHPDDDYGWSAQGLMLRMGPDREAKITDLDEMQALLDDLETQGHADRIKQGDVEVWRMTQSGFDLLNGRIANEPEEGAEVVGPAMISGFVSAGGAIKIGDSES